jgi:hypothetical protein
MKTLLVIITLFTSIAVLLPSCNCGGPIAADPEDNSESARELAERFSPIFYLKNDELPKENYEPAPVETIINHVDLRKANDSLFCEKATIINMGKNSEDIFYLDIPNVSPAGFSQSLPVYKRSYDQAMSSGLYPTVYARVTKPGVSKHTVVQYWLFYYFDEWSNLHEGDWELVELVFPNLSPKELIQENGEPEFAAYSQHFAGQRLSWAEMKGKGLIVGRTHPIVYVAQGSHANYFTPGQYWLITDFDDTGLSSWREITPELTMISEKDPENNKNQWIDFEGLWGEQLGLNISWGPLRWTQSGVNGPAWRADRNETWLQPYQWAEKVAEYPQVWIMSFLPHWSRLAIFSVFSPADIQVYDKDGNRAGLNEKGEFVTQIPGAEYITPVTPEGIQSKTIIIPNGDVSNEYTLIIKGTGNGVIDIKAQILDAQKEIKRYLEYRDIPITPNTVARLKFTDVEVLRPPLNSDCTRDNKTILEIDKNNDGEFESEVRPGTSQIVIRKTTTIEAGTSGLTNVSIKPTFVWSGSPGWTYQIDVSDRKEFDIITFSHNTDEAFYVAEETLAYNTIYYWRVGFYNQSGIFMGWGDIFDFMTETEP